MRGPLTNRTVPAIKTFITWWGKKQFNAFPPESMKIYYLQALSDTELGESNNYVVWEQRGVCIKIQKSKCKLERWEIHLCTSGKEINAPFSMQK